ncbi:unnamed protein product, partial [Hapterophycus canaliculatus]
YPWPRAPVYTYLLSSSSLRRPQEAGVWWIFLCCSHLAKKARSALIASLSGGCIRSSSPIFLWGRGAAESEKSDSSGVRCVAGEGFAIPCSHALVFGDVLFPLMDISVD